MHVLNPQSRWLIFIMAALFVAAWIFGFYPLAVILGGALFAMTVVFSILWFITGEPIHDDTRADR